jgi:hypothetical protein
MAALTQARSGYHRETDNLGKCFKIAKGIMIFHAKIR